MGAVPEGVKVEYRPGCQLIQPLFNPLDWSVYEAAGSDVTIACMGISPLMEGEEGDATLSPEQGDRAEIGLPEVQVEYIRKLAVQGAKIVLVLFGGSPISLGEVEDMVQAVVFAWYPGQEGGRAAADVLFGKQAPSGKLPLTFPKSLADLPPFEDYSMQGRTYRFAKTEPLYPFGFGLSYTQFIYLDFALTRSKLAPGESLDFSVTLQNSGSCAAEEVVQIYLSDLEASTIVPRYKLAAFRRTALQAGEQKTLTFNLPAEQFMLVDDSGNQVLEPGLFRLYAGGCSPDRRAQVLGAPAWLTAEIEIVPA
jgi:beta-glucosidase